MDRSNDLTTMLRNGLIGRREFLKRAIALGLSVPAAGALLAACGGDSDGGGEAAPATEPATPTDTGAAPAAPSGVDLEGVKIKFAKAPHGEDEIEKMEEWLQPFKDATGAEIEHTVIPWDQLEAQYTANFAGDDPFDVMYQVSTHLTLFGEQGNFEDLMPYIEREDFASERPHFPDSIIEPSVYNGKLYGIPFITGTIVNFYNLDLLKAAGLEPPTTTEELIEVGKAVTKDDVWGFHVTQTVADFNWYFNLQNVHNLGGDILSEDKTQVTINSQPVIDATQWAADLILAHKIQPPVGTYDREGGVSLFSQGKLAVLLDEPSRVVPFREQNLPFEWDIDMPVGAPNGGRTVFSTTGHWVMHSRSQNKEAAWELIKFLSTADFSSKYNLHYAFVPARDDADASGGDELLAKNQEFAVCCWDGLVTHPKIAQILDEYSKALEAACTGSSSVEDALNRAQENAEAILSS